MHPLLAAIGLVAGVLLVKAVADVPADIDLEWNAFVKGHSELHA